MRPDILNFDLAMRQRELNALIHAITLTQEIVDRYPDVPAKLVCAFI